MLDIKAKNIPLHKKSDMPNILFSWIEGDKFCDKIKENIQILEEFYSKEMDIMVIRVKWEELISLYEIPYHITPYTVFYLRFGYTIGNIENPTFEILTDFFVECDFVSLQLKNPSLINKEPPKIIKDHNNQFKIQIFSKLCPVYQFIEKSENSKSIFL